MTPESRPKRVLVVEDDALIALDISRQLSDAGFQVVGPAISVARALSLIADQGCDIAVLDVNLGDKETSEPIAHALRARSTPFLVLSGYMHEQHPHGLRGAPVLIKPASPPELVAMVLSCFDAA
ncbi:MAG: response regulator [Alphaproteobacteria bacterium]|nr:response regulator [Alphaproteobacteria bacterium]MCW5739091.1 response regulator [Alphaproteobacteria bacterium]